VCVFQEPFNDVAIGGHMIPGAVPGTMLVWAVTAHGRVSLFFSHSKSILANLSCVSGVADS